ncbi:unknown [Crocosphaera subtropica ATCC 51142]|uniref:Alpha-amylase n=1 Tax=Crocosphaera subtropica (strain ATCC 51142 / BH68) TaxID=43989 RepID=B1WXP3_CROS5|nr:glucosylglycerol hydrolase [Crocosphaera subtropica]ACB52584.1 unknown [Crocosphaera subtropica ATCC 51142]
MVTTKLKIQLVEEETHKLMEWVEQIEHSDQTVFEKAQKVATRLGAYYRPDDGLTEIGFWTPELESDIIQPKNIYLEIFTPKKDIDPTKPTQRVVFRRDYVQLHKRGEYFWGVIAGLKAGTKESFGSFYWLRYLDWETNEVRAIGDCLAYSLPYGVYAPAEVYNLHSLQANRRDMAYFLRDKAEENSDEIIYVHPPRNILQLHVNTASPDGTLAGLTELYQRIGKKLVQQEPLTPAEENYIGYDAVQLLPIEPTVEYRGKHELGHGFFMIDDKDLDEMDAESEGIEHEPGNIKITLKKPDTQNWGYDIVIFGSSATDPSVLRTLRPDEVVEFIETLHNFPTGPIKVIYDLVYGHADNQGLDLLNGRFMKGPNMYGQDVNHQNPVVRAILLEMQRRKNNTGVDGIRVDGAQDFKFFNPITGEVEYDDQYLQEMGNLIQEIGPSKRHLFAIFEDGRPWPTEGWEEISTYRNIIDYNPRAFQWGPLIFAHNTPCLKSFWEKKWRRVCEVMQLGENWITGCGNHDTLRRGTQVDPNSDINWNLGKTLPEVLHNAYDNPSIGLLTYGFSPGLPMDFINCTMRAPWGFLRNTDDRYGVKVVSEEAGGFLDWQIIPETYNYPDVFPRLKAMGFTKLGELRQFVTGLVDALAESNYDLDEVAHICQRHLGHESGSEEAKNEAKVRKSAAELQKLNGPDKSQVLTELSVAKLKEFAKAFMEDAHELSNVWLHQENLDSEQVAYNLALRRFRQANPWLRHNLKESDRFNQIQDPEKTLFYGVRYGDVEEDTESEPYGVAMIAHMRGEPMTVKLGEWLELDLDQWQIAIASPGLKIDDLTAFELHDSQAVLLEKKMI